MAHLWAKGPLKFSLKNNAYSSSNAPQSSSPDNTTQSGVPLSVKTSESKKNVTSAVSTRTIFFGCFRKSDEQEEMKLEEMSRTKSHHSESATQKVLRSALKKDSSGAQGPPTRKYGVHSLSQNDQTSEQSGVETGNGKLARKVHFEQSDDDKLDVANPRPTVVYSSDGFATFVMVSSLANQMLQYEWLSSHSRYLASSGWKKAQTTLLVCLIKKDVPSPRKYLIESYPEFTIQQVHMFNRIYFTFADEKTGRFRIQELTHLMTQLARPLDLFSIKYITENIEQQENGNITILTFLDLFRKAMNHELCNVFSIFKHIAHWIAAQEAKNKTLLVVEKSEGPNRCGASKEKNTNEGTSETNTSISSRGNVFSKIGQTARQLLSDTE
ncbi:hypothetical protein L5515_019716 [Caenorhabditis briggsae]|uniref:EF-hand domain-containing protein n=1 Tax=Caenorhabditis briggsae TaxID=6238 RepID=A0AAE9FER5_CAEBR|nr:hypothetical protein L5515_019716 [Caenorhabditis briggsae]